MDIAVIGDRVELNGFGLAVIQGDASPSLKADFERFLQGRNEAELNGAKQLTDDDVDAAYLSEIEDLKGALEDLCDAIEKGNQGEIDDCFLAAREML